MDDNKKNQLVLGALIVAAVFWSLMCMTISVGLAMVIPGPFAFDVGIFAIGGLIWVGGLLLGFAMADDKPKHRRSSTW